jgi:hypothetical protein
MKILLKQLKVTVLLAILSVISLSAAMPSQASALIPKKALIYGDSITWESRYATADQFKLKKGWTYVN